MTEPIALEMIETTNQYGEQGLKVFSRTGYPVGGLKVQDLLDQVRERGYSVENWTWTNADEFVSDLAPTESVLAVFCYLS